MTKNLFLRITASLDAYEPYMILDARNEEKLNLAGKAVESGVLDAGGAGGVCAATRVQNDIIL